MATISQFRDALVVLETKEGWADICDARYDSNPYDEDAERAFDQAYREEWEAFGKAVKMLVDLTGMDVSAANTLLRAKREKVMGIVKRWRGIDNVSDRGQGNIVVAGEGDQRNRDRDPSRALLQGAHMDRRDCLQTRI